MKKLLVIFLTLLALSTLGNTLSHLLKKNKKALKTSEDFLNNT